MRRLLTLTVVSLAALLCTSVVAPVATASPNVRIGHATIPGHNGVSLDAKVIEPAGAEGPRPLLVMPASWATPNIEYVGAAARLAYRSGYVVVSYTARGFYASEGAIEVAGAEDVADASKVIDWAVANTAAGAEHVGMAGISYGAGISALTAAADSRVDAIAALSGWADLARSLYPNRTVSTQTAEMLLALGHLTGRPGEDLRKVERAYREDDIEEALPLVDERSPVNGIERLNNNGTAVMIGNAWQDSIFPPKQMTDMFRRLNGPKRLMLGPGDHATQEAFGALGLPSKIWESATRWFNHHLKGVENGVSAEDPVRLRPLNGGGRQGYPDWRSVSANTDRLRLGVPRRHHPFAPKTGRLAEDAPAKWRHAIETGEPTLAESGTAMISGTLQAFARIPVGVSVPFVDRSAAGVWAGQPLSRDRSLSGTAMLSTTIVPDDESVSLFAYLYEVDSHGNGSLITHKPFTLREARPGQETTVDIALQPVLWRVSRGHRLVLVVDTVDGRYRDESDRGTVTFESTPTSPSTLTLPYAG